MKMLDKNQIKTLFWSFWILKYRIIFKLTDTGYETFVKTIVTFWLLDTSVTQLYIKK